MVVEIKFLEKPKFALGAKFDPGAHRAFSGKPIGTEAATVNISAAGSAKGEKASKVTGQSVFSQLTNQLKEISSRIKELDKALEGSASGTAEHAALEKERSGLEEEFQRITSPTAPDGTQSSFSSILAFLESATDKFSHALSSEALSQAITLFGNDGAAFLQRGGATAAQEIADALRGIATDAGSISDPATASRIDDTLTRIDALFTGEIYENVSGSATAGSVSKRSNGSPIQLKEVDFAAAGQISLGLQSASPEDLMKAAASGVDLNVVNHLLLKPESFDPKAEGRRQTANESIIELTKEDNGEQQPAPY